MAPCYFSSSYAHERTTYVHKKSNALQNICIIPVVFIIIGASVGGALLLVLLVILHIICCCVCCRKK